MESFYMIIPIALLFCLLAGWVWMWASKSGQFDDLDREARRILEEEEATCPKKTAAFDHQANKEQSL